ncbi:MAG: Nif3-like dinuclear metal center hexameric protein [Candidatus Cloacimonetes bacterium]|nr:Nif3-like dinuclear metal center hexameric protein [Candidatus Cloacimonadota bacterium]
MTVNDIIALIHRFAPPMLAYEWDNVGFLLGDANWQVKKILLSLDVTPNTLKKAIELNANLIISHHPLIFRPIKKITNPLYLELIRNNIAVISAHTNLDVTRGGVNHKLAEIFGLTSLELLSSETGAAFYQVAVYVPYDAVDAVKYAVFQAGAGIIGNYSHCLNSYPVKGQFQPLPGSNPTYGTLNQLQNMDEIKLEFSVDSFNLTRVITALKKAHPYETPAYAVYPQQRNSENYGLGLIGQLDKPAKLIDFAETVKRKLNAPALKLWLADKSANTMINKIAVCGGSGASLISAATGRADIFLSGEFGYHSTLDSRIPLLEAGHFHTEFPAMQIFADLLAAENLEIITLSPQEHEINSNLIHL